MKTKKLFWLFSLMVLFSFCFVACGDDDDDESPNFTIKVKAITFDFANGVVNEITVKGITIYMSTDQNFTTNNALMNEKTNDEGVATFVVNSKALNNFNIQTFYFAVEGYNEKLVCKISVSLNAGETKDAEMELNQNGVPFLVENGYVKIYTHTVDDLVGAWVWETVSGDLPDEFEVKISKISDTQFKIDNFANSYEAVTVTVSKTNTLSFSGELEGGYFIISQGTGNIINGWNTMNINFILINEDGEQNCAAQLEKGSLIQ